MVKTVVCPSVSLPKDYSLQKKRKIEANGPPKDERRPDWKRPRASDLHNSSTSSTKEEIKGIYKSIKDLAATSYTGMAKKKHKEDILTQLGAPAVKQQKMPFKMRVRINEAAKKRETKAVENAKISGVVTAGSSSSKKRQGKSGKSWSDRDDNDSNFQSFGAKTKGGVLHIPKSMLGKRK
jgi:hypothetical protein